MKTKLTVAMACGVALLMLSNAQASISISWSLFGDGALFDKDGAAIPQGNPGLVLFNAYAHNGTAADVQTWASDPTQISPLTGSTLLTGADSPWYDTGSGWGGAGSGASHDGSGVNVNTALANRNVYILFTYNGQAGYIWGSNLTLPSNPSAGDNNLLVDLSRAQVANTGVGGTTVSGQSSGWATTNVPEPGSIALFALGMVAVAALRRSRR